MLFSLNGYFKIKSNYIGAQIMNPGIGKYENGSISHPCWYM